MASGGGGGVDAEDPIDAMIGHRVHDMLLVRVLALGTYGAVYLAERNGTRERYAVKCLFKTGLKPEHLVLQHVEIAVHEQLRGHPNLVGLVDTLETADHLFLVFEYASRGDLYEFIKHEAGGIYDKSLAQRLLVQIASGLQFCHARSIYHRDIKPENVLLTDDWAAKLSDFGLATRTAAPSEYGCGSAPYMAPEVIDRTTPTYGAAAADVWSLGIVFFNMLFGVNPWEKAVDTDRRFRSYVAAPTAYLASRFQMSPAVHTLFQHVLHPDPSRRLSLAAFRDRVAGLDVAELYPMSSVHYSASPAVSMQTHPLRSRPIVPGSAAATASTAAMEHQVSRPSVPVTVGVGFGGSRATADSGWHQDHAAASIPKSRASSGHSNATSMVVGSWADEIDLPMDFTAPIVFQERTAAGGKVAASAPSARGLSSMLAGLSSGSRSSDEGDRDGNGDGADDASSDAGSHSSEGSHDIFALDLVDDAAPQPPPLAATARAGDRASQPQPPLPVVPAPMAAGRAAQLPPLAPASGRGEPDSRLDRTRNALHAMRLSPPRRAEAASPVPAAASPLERWRPSPDDSAAPMRPPSVLVVSSR